jgi:hypothetical protein
MLTYITSCTLYAYLHHILYSLCLLTSLPILDALTCITSYTLYAFTSHLIHLYHILYSIYSLTSHYMLTYITSSTRYAYLHHILLHRRCFYEFRRSMVHLQYSYAFWRAQRSVSITDGVFKRSQMFKNITPKVFPRVQEEQGALTVRFLMRTYSKIDFHPSVTHQ